MVKLTQQSGPKTQTKDEERREELATTGRVPVPWGLYTYTHTHTHTHTHTLPRTQTGREFRFAGKARRLAVSITRGYCCNSRLAAANVRRQVGSVA